MQSYMIATGGGRTQTRVFEVGQGTPLLYMHAAGGLYEGDPFLLALG